MFEVRYGQGHGRAWPHLRLRVADPGGDAQQHGNFPTFGNFNRRQRKIIRFLRISRLEHRHAGSHGITAVVLLVLTRSHSGIVGRDHHQCAHDPRVSDTEQRIGRDIDPHVLHRDERARPGIGDADADFERDFFIRRPLSFAANLREGFEDFRGGSSGITGAQRHATMFCRERDGCVAAEKLSIGGFHCDCDWLEAFCNNSMNHSGGRIGRPAESAKA